MSSNNTATDELGFVEVKISDNSTSGTNHHHQETNKEKDDLSQLSIEELQRLCQQEELKVKTRKQEDAIWEGPKSEDEKKVEDKQLAKDILKNESASLTGETMEETLKRRVNEMAVEVGKSLEQNHQDVLPKPSTTTSTETIINGDDLPSWFHNLEPEVQKEFLDAMNVKK